MKKILRDLSQPEIFNACTSIDLDRFLGEYNVESNQIQCLKKVIITRKTLSSNSTNLENNNSESCCVSESVSKSLLLQHRESRDVRANNQSGISVFSGLTGNSKITSSRSIGDSVTFTVCKSEAIPSNKGIL